MESKPPVSIIIDPHVFGPMVKSLITEVLAQTEADRTKTGKYSTKRGINRKSKQCLELQPE